MLNFIFRMPPIVYFILAPLVLAASVFLYFQESDYAAQRAAALSHDAPAEIALTDITSDETGNDYNEIVVRVQGDVMNTIEVVRTKRGSERGRKVYMPLFPADAEDLSGPVLAVMQVDETLSDEQLGNLYVEDGPAAPVFLINGVLEGGANSGAVSALGNYVNLAPGFRTIKPFIDGREAALSEQGLGSTLLIIGLVLALILGGYGYFRKRRLDAEREAEEMAYAEPGHG